MKKTKLFKVTLTLDIHAQSKDDAKRIYSSVVNFDPNYPKRLIDAKEVK